uniref:Peptidase S54 rhomboid domain-containing protein n=1 Tax=Favella ehrenbergii TaxID=182087 RepID=A0A7S3MLQ0_9SPIT|mmetsp:Transcript_1516/g.2211  ORF Transcript_1516/g.2211 Transcript_1516/m.2211 type:complete len:200 (+) Transcript_1516:25-624(+)
MNRLPASVGQSLQVLKGMPLPPAFRTENMPMLVRNLFLGQLGFFGLYSLVSGPNRMKLKRYFTVSPESGLQSLATFHLCHTGAISCAFNLGILGSIGSAICRQRGAGALTTLLGLGAAGASIAVAMDARSNPAQVQAGSMGLSAAMLTYAAFKMPGYFALVRFQPMTFVAAAIAYGMMYDDKAAIGGITAGYLAFLLAL